MSTSLLRGFLTIAICFVALGTTFSTRATLGIAIPIWEAEFGWTRSFISSGGALALLVTAVLAPLTGYIVDRHGARGLLTAGLVLSAISMGWVANMAGPLGFIAAYGVLGALGFGLVSMNAVATTAARAFPSRVGLASGIASSGSTGGQLIFVPLIAALVAAEGWRAGYTAAALACLALALPIWFLTGQGGGAAPQRETTPGHLRRELATIFAHPAFVILFGTFVVCGVTTAGVIETHLLPYAEACGFDKVPAATAYGLLSAFNLGGMILAGWLSDHVHRGRLLAAIYLMRAVAFVLLIQVGADYRLLLAFAVLFGIFDYSTVPVTAGLVAGNLGLHRMGFAMGLLIAGHGVGAAAGAYAGGVLFDRFADYQPVWIASVILAFAAGIAALMLSEPRERAAPA